MQRDYKTLFITLLVFCLALLFFLLSEAHFSLKGILDADSPAADKSYFNHTPRRIKPAPVQDSSSRKDTLPSPPVRILIAGDSMCEGLMRRLNDYCTYNNYDLNGVIWSSSSTVAWSSHDTLKYYINRYKPNYLFFVIGSNELLTPNSKARENYIKKIDSQMSGVRSIWIGPPNWRNDNGINSLIQSIVGAGRFFPSKNLTYQRLKDGAHPTMESAAKWMDSIAVWIRYKSKYPLAFKVPASGSNKARNITYLSTPENNKTGKLSEQLTTDVEQKIVTEPEFRSESEVIPETETQPEIEPPK